MDNNNQQPNNFNLPQPIPESPAITTQEGAMQPTAAVSSSVPPSPMALRAHHGDSIEQEWIRAVEALIRQHIDDPRRLSEEFGKLKARYIKERYDKELKSQPTEGQ